MATGFEPTTEPLQLTDGVRGSYVDVDFCELLDDRRGEDEGVAILRPVWRKPVRHDGRLVLVRAVRQGA